MEKAIEYSAKVTKREICGCIYFFVFSDKRRWFFILGTTVAIAGLLGTKVLNVWLVGLLWLSLLTAIIIVTGYFNMVKPTLAVDHVFAPRDYKITYESIAIKSVASARRIPITHVGRLVELRNFFIITGREPVLFLPKKLVPASDVELMRDMFGKAKIRSGRFRMWAGQFLFGI